MMMMMMMMSEANVFGYPAGDVGKDRGVGVGGKHDAGVPEHVLDDFQVDTHSEGEAGAVAQVVQADRRQGAGVVELAEVARQPVRRHGITVKPGEYVATVEVVLPGSGALGELPCAVGTQGRDGGAVQGDHPLTMSRLGRAQGDVAVVLLELPGDDRGAGIEVDIAPAQPGGFAAPQAAQRNQACPPPSRRSIAPGSESRGTARMARHRWAGADGQQP